MRLRPLTEAECYARCYGGVRSEQVSVLRPPSTRDAEPDAVRLSEHERPAELREEAA